MTRPLYDEYGDAYDSLRPGRALVMDVRELEATRARYAGGRTLRRDGL